LIRVKKYNFTILFEKDEDGIYVASVPALPGCHTQAQNLEELFPRIREAIKLCLEVQKEDVPL
jgi:predicted RNase H-like HicB family nuclease